MLGLMQDWPLLCHRIIDHAAIQHADRPVVSRSVEGPIHTTNYAEIRTRALKLAQRLDRDGIKLGDRVATMAWNTWRHIECLVRHPRHRRDLSHRQSAAVPRPDLLDRQSRRRPADVRRSDVPADAGEARRRLQVDRALRRPDRRRAHAGDHAEERGALRGMDRRGRRRLRLEELRREHRRRHVLHLRHHRQSQGRALLAPLQRAARLHGVAAGCQGHQRARRGAAGRAAVSRQLLVARLLDADDRRIARHAGSEARRRVDLRTARQIQGDVHRRRADGLADAARSTWKRTAPSCRISSAS